MYNYNHLYYFYVTVKSGGVTRAAAHLQVSQPSLSSQLKILEQSLDMKLFQKVGRVNELTEAGNTIFGFCRRMFEVSEEMTELISDRIPSGTRRIHIGVSDEVDRTFVAEVVSLFLKKHGLAHRPRVTVTSGKRTELADRLRFRELDAMVTELSMPDPDLVNIQKAEVPVTLTCSSKWKMKSDTTRMKASAAIRELVGGEDAQWVLPSPKFKLRGEIDRFFEQNALKGRVVFESDVVASIVRSVIDEIGLAFLPLLYVARELRENTIRILGPRGGYWKYRVWLVCHKQNRNDALIHSLSRSFREVCSASLHVHRREAD